MNFLTKFLQGLIPKTQAQKFACIDAQVVETEILFYRKIKVATISEELEPNVFRDIRIFDIQGIGVYHFENGENTPTFMWRLAEEKFKTIEAIGHQERTASIIDQVKQYANV